jgi:hypothetical protein
MSAPEKFIKNALNKRKGEAMRFLIKYMVLCTILGILIGLLLIKVLNLDEVDPSRIFSSPEKQQEQKERNSPARLPEGVKET